MLRAVVLVALLTTTAYAEPWYRGEHGTNRVVHLSLTTVGLIAYPLFLYVEKHRSLAVCRWCDPTGLDRVTRDALRWDDHAKTAARISDVTAYGVAPLSIGLVALGTLDEPSWATAIDDFTPILETMVVTEWVTLGLKLAIGRQRPYAHYTEARSYEDNLSFPSGHTSRAFALVTSAAMIARARGYRSEPYVWIAGMTAAAATGYFRVAADKHYLLDVLAGAALGTGAGLTVPLLMRRNAVVLVPGREGVALAGSW